SQRSHTGGTYAPAPHDVNAFSEALCETPASRSRLKHSSNTKACRTTHPVVQIEEQFARHCPLDVASDNGLKPLIGECPSNGIHARTCFSGRPELDAPAGCLHESAWKLRNYIEGDDAAMDRPRDRCLQHLVIVKS